MASENRQNLPEQTGTRPPAAPGLWVVATPIGNLGDLTDRGKLALQSACAVWCEDTRRTRQLLAALGVSAAAVERVDDAHLGPGRVAEAIEKLRSIAGQGGGVALVSDAGTPGVSDPGARIVAHARAAGIAVTPIPGVSAVTAFWSGVGVGVNEGTELVFSGFVPREKKEWEARLDSLNNAENRPFVTFFESPHRIVGTLEALAGSCPGAWVVAAKELTKIHERWFSGEAREVANAVSREIEREGERGEWVFGFRLPSAKDVTQTEKKLPESWEITLECLLSCGVKLSEAARETSQRFGVSRNEVYDVALKLQKKFSGD